MKLHSCWSRVPEKTRLFAMLIECCRSHDEVIVRHKPKTIIAKSDEITDELKAEVVAMLRDDLKGNRPQFGPVTLETIRVLSPRSRSLLRPEGRIVECLVEYAAMAAWKCDGKICPTCDKLFLPFRMNTRFCTIDCKRKAMRPRRMTA